MAAAETTWLTTYGLWLAGALAAAVLARLLWAEACCWASYALHGNKNLVLLQLKVKKLAPPRPRGSPSTTPSSGDDGRGGRGGGSTAGVAAPPASYADVARRRA